MIYARDVVYYYTKLTLIGVARVLYTLLAKSRFKATLLSSDEILSVLEMLCTWLLLLNTG